MTASPLFDDLYSNLANMALTYYKDADFSPENLRRNDFSTAEQLVSADIRDLYKNANLPELFDYLEELTESQADLETTFLYENRETLADYIIRAHKELNS